MEKVDLRYNSPHDWTMFDGERISQKRARRILPMLIERANEGRTISYGELAKEFDMNFALPILYSVVCITGTLYQLERNKLCEAKFKWKYGKILRIANMVTKTNGKPAGFVQDNLEKSEDLQPLLDRIYDYKHWNEVLEALGLKMR